MRAGDWPTPAEVHALYDRERAAERDVAESLAPFIIRPAAELADALSILSAAVSGVHAVGDVWDESPAAEAWFTDRMADEMVDRLRAEGVDDDEIAVQVAQLRTDVAE
jgi:hypothetical protein